MSTIEEVRRSRCATNAQNSLDNIIISLGHLIINMQNNKVVSNKRKKILIIRWFTNPFLRIL